MIDKDSFTKCNISEIIEVIKGDIIELAINKKVDAYFAWAKQKYSQVTHNSTIGKALAYSINQEEYLRVFLSDGHVPMDNNYAEQAIRPFTIGRKNFVMINLLMVQRQVPSCTVWSKQQMQT